MKFFLKKSIGFIIALLITSFLVQQIVFLFIRSIDAGELGVMNKIIEGKINAEVLISGSSRSFVGIDPSIINKSTGLSAFNISLNGSRLGIQLPVLKTYLKYNKKPRILIQEVGFESLRVDENIYTPYKYLPFLSNEELYSGLKKIDPDLWMHKYIPLANLIYFNSDFQKMFLKDFFATLGNGNDYLKKGYKPHENSWAMNEISLLKTRQEYFSITNKGKKYLSEIIKLCNNNNIRIMLVTTPIFSKLKKYNNSIDNMIKTYNKIADTYNILFFSYLDLNLSKEKKFFYNFTHLTENGAEELSYIISNDIEKNFETITQEVDTHRQLSLK